MQQWQVNTLYQTTLFEILLQEHIQGYIEALYM